MAIRSVTSSEKAQLGGLLLSQPAEQLSVRWPSWSLRSGGCCAGSSARYMRVYRRLMPGLSHSVTGSCAARHLAGVWLAARQAPARGRRIRGISSRERPGRYQRRSARAPGSACRLRAELGPQAS
jgi:hypothetical protein